MSLFKRKTLDEDKEYKKLARKISFAINGAMKKGLSPILIKSALEDCPMCKFFNDDNYENLFSKVPDENNQAEVKKEVEQ